MIFYYIYLAPLTLSVLSSLSMLRLDWPKPFKLFSAFLTLTLIVELSAFLWSYSLHKTSWWNFSPNNIWIYNSYLIPQYLFYIYFFSKTVGVRWMSKTGLYIGIGYFLVATQNLLFIQKLFLVNYITIILANFIIVFFTLIYFIQLMKAKEVIRLSRQPLFWIAAGSFIFHLGSLPCFILYNYISAGNSLLATSLFRIIIMLNCIMYLLYSIAFLCTKRFQMSPS